MSLLQPPYYLENGDEIKVVAQVINNGEILLTSDESFTVFTHPPSEVPFSLKAQPRLIDGLELTWDIYDQAAYEGFVIIQKVEGSEILRYSSEKREAVLGLDPFKTVEFQVGTYNSCG